MRLEAGRLFSLEDRTVLLTGASGFLGRTMARALLANGARLLLLGRSPRFSEMVSALTREFGKDRVRAYRIDMSRLGTLARTLDRVVADEPAIDVLVNNAHEMGRGTGFNVTSGRLERATLDQWWRNLMGGVCWPALTVQKLGPAMKRRRRGSIVNVATMYALVAPSPKLYTGTRYLNPPGYSAAKAGMLAFTRYVASFWGPFGIRCNAILPGPFPNTETAGPNAVRRDARFLDRLRSRTCLGRVGTPEELAGALLFLASDASSFVTGQALVVDGGWTVT